MKTAEEIQALMEREADGALAHWLLAGWPTSLPTPSSYERVAECPRSEAMPHVRRQSTAHATLGTIAHAFFCDCALVGRDEALMRAPDDAREWLETIDLGKMPIRSEFWPEVAVAYDLHANQARVLGHNLTREQAAAMKKPTETVGLMDVGADNAEDDSVFVGDFKTGFGYVAPAPDNWQLRGYALYLARARGRSKAIISVIRIRPGSDTPYYDTAHLDDEALMHFEFKLLDMFAERERVRQLTREKRWSELPPYSEGEWCTYCPAKTSCPVKIGAMAVAAADVGVPLNLTPEKAARYWRMADTVKDSLERWGGVLEDYALETPFPLGTGGVWVGPLNRNPAETIMPEKARKILTEKYGELGGAVFSDAVEISDSMTKANLKRALRKIILPTRPGMTMTLLEKEVHGDLRMGGAMAAKPLKKIPVGEYRPKVVEKDSLEVPPGEDVETEAA